MLPKDDNVTHQSGKPGVDRIRYDFCKKNLDKLNEALSDKFSEERHFLFINVFNESMNKTCMLKTVKSSKRNKVRNPWISCTLSN